MPSKNTLPRYIAVELNYSYLTEPVIYTFPRLRKADADADERERILGDGKKLTPAQRLSMLVTDVQGWGDFNPRGIDESLLDFRRRVLLFFDNEEMNEFAEDALLYRISGVYPTPLFRSSTDRGVAGGIQVEPPGGDATLAPLSDLPEAR